MAEVKFPSYEYYGDFEQIENGIGLVPAYMRDMRKLSLPKKIAPCKVTTLTGVSFWPYLKDTVKKFNNIEGLILTAHCIENSLFGPHVTVAGLLSGRCNHKSASG